MILTNFLSTKKLISFGKVIRFPHWESIFRAVFCAVFAVTLFNFGAVLNFREYAKREGIYVIDWADLKILPQVWVIIYIVKSLIKYFTIGYVTANLHEKYQGRDRELRIKKIIKWFYDGSYYLAVTVCQTYHKHQVISWVLFRESDWFPTSLGGQGSCENIYGGFPNFPGGEVHKYLTLFYLIQFASHCYSMLELIIFDVEIKFWEYLLHHYVACTLIFFSLTLNIRITVIHSLVKIGMIVLVVHDISDILLSISRAYCDMKGANQILVYSQYVLLQISWIYTRLWVYPTCVIGSNSVSTFEPHHWYTLSNYHPREIIKLPINFQTVLLYVLLGMHIYWNFYMLKVGMGIFKSGKYKNVYDNKENRLDEEIKKKN